MILEEELCFLYESKASWLPCLFLYAFLCFLFLFEEELCFKDEDDVYEEGLCFLYESKADAIKFFSTTGDKSDAGQ